MTARRPTYAAQEKHEPPAVAPAVVPMSDPRVQPGTCPKCLTPFGDARKMRAHARQCTAQRSASQ